MKRILLGALSLVLVAGLMTTTSCKKGDQGPKGDSAMANVYYSPWKDVGYSIDQIITYTNGTKDTTYIAEMEAPEITKDILDKGVVKVFLNQGADPVNQPYVTPLPYFDLLNVISINADYFLGKIYLSANVNASTRVRSTDNVHFNQYRYVVIPGGVKVGARTANGPAVDWNDYNSVKAYLNIKD